ncbi:MAG TPA: UdgX family uracil-DNA binding protein [Steroidobacteraceae bacterium]|jgi:DNA polymerase|nr:UdgX family uracil-DNA binding protein [Steroidobacteraceae bacterium]
MFDQASYQSFDSWRQGSRSWLQAQAAPGTALTLPREVMRLLRSIAHYRDPGRWDLMTRLALRTLIERRSLIDDVVDPDVRRARLMERAVRRDIHKMHAFVRFREVPAEDGSHRYFAWFEPAHEILRLGAPFFVRRFANMHWTIATPDGTAMWDQHELRYLESPATQGPAGPDPQELLWRTYYRSICNVSRINPRAMQREMPQRYWNHLPEAAEIGPLMRDGRERFERRSVTADIESIAQAQAVRRALDALPSNQHDDLAHCQRCDLYRHATQAVAGEGPAMAPLMLVGEQPGDEEDLRGKPFIGPAGRLLDQLLQEAGIARAEVYVTNAVKHFKWEPRGKRRLHKRPDQREIAACGYWLQRELEAVAPRIIVALGASAQSALLGSRQTIDSARGKLWPHDSGAQVIVTYHPSALLRARDDSVDRMRAALLKDLSRAAELALGKSS